jgi:site-specific recombinase XerD
LKALFKSDFFSLLHDYLKVYLPAHKRCSEHTIRSYANAVELLLDFVTQEKNIKLSEITFETIDSATIISFIESLERKGCSVGTCNQRLYSIRAFYNYASNMQPTITAFKSEVDKVPVKRDKMELIVSYMDEAAIKTILEQPLLNTKKGLRDRTMLVLLYDSAARIQELLDIRVCDLKLATASSVILRGKGNKVRTVPIMAKTVELIKKYLAVFHQESSEYSEMRLFYTEQHRSKQRMCEDNVRRLLTRYANDARELCKSVPDKVHPHMMRHSRAMHLYKNGMDLTLISQWLGHANLDTTQIYAYADTEQKRKAIELATTNGNALRSKNSERYIVEDEDTLKRLCGLR